MKWQLLARRHGPSIVNILRRDSELLRMILFVGLLSLLLNDTVLSVYITLRWWRCEGAQHIGMPWVY